MEQPGGIVGWAGLSGLLIGLVACFAYLMFLVGDYLAQVLIEELLALLETKRKRRRRAFAAAEKIQAQFEDSSRPLEAVQQLSRTVESVARERPGTRVSRRA